MFYHSHVTFLKQPISGWPSLLLAEGMEVEGG